MRTWLPNNSLKLTKAGLALLGGLDARGVPSLRLATFPRALLRCGLPVRPLQLNEGALARPENPCGHLCLQEGGDQAPVDAKAVPTAARGRVLRRA